MFDQSRQEDDDLKLGDLARTALKVARKLPVKEVLATVYKVSSLNTYLALTLKYYSKLFLSYFSCKVQTKLRF